MTKRPFLWPKLGPGGGGRQSTQGRAAVTAAEGRDAFQANGHMRRVCIHVCDFKLKAVHSHTHTHTRNSPNIGSNTIKRNANITAPNEKASTSKLPQKSF